MITYTSIPANYKSTGVRRFDGNPFIEALPSLERSKDEILDRLKNYPQKPTKSDRSGSELVRAAEVGCINEIVYPFAEYKRAGTNLTMNLRESYVARNPLSIQDVQRRHAIALNESGPVPFPSDWISTAKGQTLLGISGSGKTTFAIVFFCRTKSSSNTPHITEDLWSAARFLGWEFECLTMPPSRAYAYSFLK